MNWNGKTALITGASVGIGECFARYLAKEQANLILVARRKEKMEQLAAELAQKHGIKVEVIAADLGKPDAAKQLFAETERRKLQVDLLINNAGFGIGGAFLDESLDRNLEMIQLNITTLVALTHLYLKPMVARKNGAIINVASTAAFQPVPFLGAYSASKAFVLSFSEALWEEYREHNVTVMALCPGTTSTEFFEVAKVKERTVAQTPEEVVENAFRGLRGKRSHIISGFMNYLMAQSNRLAPRQLATMIAGSLFRPKK
ncbi:MAG: SDR family oxidoreductase [Blastocatellia bacterium]|nr:SDR family oxidoreductase [Blastocatellia bacterium]